MLRKAKDWLNPHNDYHKEPQNLENKLAGLHFPKAFLSGLICWRGGCFQESLLGEYKSKLDKSEKNSEDFKKLSSQRFRFFCLALSKIVLLQ